MHITIQIPVLVVFATLSHQVMYLYKILIPFLAVFATQSCQVSMCYCYLFNYLFSLAVLATLSCQASVLLTCEPLMGRSQPMCVNLNELCVMAMNRMKNVPHSLPFHHPVQDKKLPSYYKIITSPMDLETMRNKCKKHMY